MKTFLNIALTVLAVQVTATVGVVIAGLVSIARDHYAAKRAAKAPKSAAIGDGSIATQLVFEQTRVSASKSAAIEAEWLAMDEGA